MEIRYLQPAGLMRSPAFSHGAVIPPGATTIYIGGQNGVDEAGQVIANHDAAAQAVRAVDNVETVLRAAGATLADVVAWTVLIAADADGDTSGRLRASRRGLPRWRDLGCAIRPRWWRAFLSEGWGRMSL
jgi:enamine deaminase RidA (YjgF/YER057c/UK114 family)